MKNLLLELGTAALLIISIFTFVFFVRRGRKFQVTGGQVAAALWTLIVITMLVMASVGTAYGQYTTTEAIKIEDGQRVVLDLNSPNVEVKETKGSRVLVEITVSISGSGVTSALESYIAQSGRYDISSTVSPDRGTVTLSAPSNDDVLVVKGQTCEEQVYYTIYVPEHIRYVAPKPTAKLVSE